MALRTKLAALGAAAALVAPVVAVAAATPAAAAASSARIYISPSPYHAGYYDVYVSGHIHTTQFAKPVGMRLKGDDPIFNDDLGVSATGTAYNGDFSLYALVHRSTLNEDWEGRDEVFAAVNASGWSKDTQNWNAYF